jgi:hypothetical protein
MLSALRTIFLIAVFAGVGIFTARWITAYAVNGSTPEAQIRLAAAMAGLFAGGAACMLVGILMVAIKRD